MKKKLIAIVTSLAMVATMVPATAAAATQTNVAGTKNVAQTKLADATRNFTTAVDYLLGADKVTKDNVRTESEQCATALGFESSVPKTDYSDAGYIAAKAKLDAEVEAIKKICVPLMETAINEKAQAGKVLVNDNFESIRQQMESLGNIGMTLAEIKGEVKNYTKYEEAMDARELANLIDTTPDLKSKNMTEKGNAVEDIKYSKAYIDAGNDTVRAYAENFKVFDDADKAVSSMKVDNALITNYTARLDRAADNLPELQNSNAHAVVGGASVSTATSMSIASINTRIKEAEALLEAAEQDTKLEKALKTAKDATPGLVTAYDTARDDLKDAIDEAFTVKANKEAADTFKEKVNAIPNAPTAKDTAGMQEIYQMVISMAYESGLGTGANETAKRANIASLIVLDKAAGSATAFKGLFESATPADKTITNWGVEVDDTTIANAYRKLCAMKDYLATATNFDTAAKTKTAVQDVVDSFYKAIPDSITTTDYKDLIDGALAVFTPDDVTVSDPAGITWNSGTDSIVGVDVTALGFGSAAGDTSLASLSVAGLKNVDRLKTKIISGNTSVTKTVPRQEREKAEDFMTMVLVDLKDKKTTDADYEIELNKALKAYEGLPEAYKKGGAEYEATNIVTSLAAYSVKNAYDTDYDSKNAPYSLKTLLNNYKKEQANAGQNAIFSELVKGINALPATITIADKDTVYALRDKRDALTAAQKETFSNDYETYDKALDKAIKAVDEAVVADLNKTLGELTIIDAKATPEDIQKAKAANKAARDEYEKLTDTQKAVVTNYPNLQAAEAAVEAAEVQYTKDQMAAVIKDIDLNALTEEQAKAILAVNDMINALNGAQKTEVEKDSNYAVFQEAVKAANGGKPIDPIEQPTDLSKDASVAAIANQIYTGKAKTPAVTVTAGGKTLVKGTDYTVTYDAKTNTNIGRSTVTITGTGDYTGTITKTFIITPAKGTVTKVTAGKKKVTVSYKTQKSYDGKTGYRIICKAKGLKAIGVNTTAAGKKTVSKLKSGKTYQVKVRAYKTIGGHKYWGSYSAVKKVKVK